MDVTLDVDNKYALLLADEFERLKLHAGVLAAHIDPQHVIHVRVAVDDLSDWDLRYAVLQAKRAIEQEWDVEIVCTLEARPAADLPV